jgi:hypothetical protein
MNFEPTLISQLLLAFASAVMGAGIGGLARWSAARRDRRLRLTLDLYSEFHSPAFNELRIKAHAALASGGAVPAAYASADDEAKAAISSIVHFWEKTAQLLKIGALHERLLRQFFGQYARWWGELLCDRPQGLSDAEWGATLTDIQWLFERLKRAQRQGARR